MKPTLQQISEVPMPPKIPMLKEEYDGQLIVIHFTDDSVSEYEFDRGPSHSRHHESLLKYESDMGHLLSKCSPDEELTRRLKRYFIRINQVYTFPL